MGGAPENIVKPLRAPFPYFGGKSRVAHLVWQRFGNVDNYVEPFAGSLAVYLARPTPHKYSLVNDLYGDLVNFWRAVKHKPEQVVEWAGGPKSSIDMVSRHNWLLRSREERVKGLVDNPEWCDAQAAGYWLYDACAAIGNCAHRGGLQTHQKLPEVANDRGIFSRLLRGRVSSVMAEISARLHRTSITCMEWHRVCTPAITIDRTGKHGRSLCGIFLDPPYVVDKVYHHDSNETFHQVVEWAIKRGEHERTRIAVCGYDTGERIFPASWECVAWSAQGGYANVGKTPDKNRHRERIWFSPHCQGAHQRSLF